MIHDLKLISEINCYVLEPVPNDSISKSVVGEGWYSPDRELHALFLDLLSGDAFVWRRENLGITYEYPYGRQIVPGWQLQMPIGDFLDAVKDRGPTGSEIDHWLAKLQTFNPGWSVQCSAQQAKWSLIDHLKGDYQDRTAKWVETCFGPEDGMDVRERANRFMEEAIELFQAAGGTEDDVSQLAGHVFSKPVGDPDQETGGVLLTLSALSNAQKIDMLVAGENELDRVWTIFPRIRAKHANAIKGSPLPGKLPEET